jgi:hypothetical protein
VVPAQAAAQGRAVLRNLLLAWSPFDSTEYRVVVRGNTAWAWAWDREGVSLMLPAESASADIQPETLYTAPAGNDLPRLVRCLEGAEGQVWKGNDLWSSRWWPQTPTADEWHQWCRSQANANAGANGVADADVMPGLQEPAWLSVPWAEGLSVEQLLSSGSRLESAALGAALVALVGLSAVEMRQVWAAHTEHQERLIERDRLAATAAPVRLARDRALALSSEAEVLSKQLLALQPLEVLMHLSERLPARGVILKEFELNDQRLRIALDAAPDVARTAIVKDLQASGWLQQVTEVRDSAGRGWLWFEMQVQGGRPPPAAASPAARAASGVAVLPTPTTGTAGFPIPTGPGTAPGARP